MNGAVSIRQPIAAVCFLRVTVSKTNVSFFFFCCMHERLVTLTDAYCLPSFFSALPTWVYVAGSHQYLLFYAGRLLDGICFSLLGFYYHLSQIPVQNNASMSFYT